MSENNAHSKISIQETMIQDLHERLSNSSTIFSPVIKIKSTELFQHLVIEATLSYYHFSRAVKCRNMIDRSITRLIEDMQSILRVSDDDLMRKGLKIEDTIIIAIKERNIVESRNLFEETWEKHYYIGAYKSSEKNKCELPHENLEMSSDTSLYGHFRREEFLCYHHLMKVLKSESDWQKNHQRLLEDIESIFCIPLARTRVEKIIADADPITHLIRRNKISKNRALFEGRFLDDSYTLPDNEFEMAVLGDSSSTKETNQSLIQKESTTVDQLCLQIMEKQRKFRNKSITAFELSSAMEKTLARIQDIKQELAKNRAAID